MKPYLRTVLSGMIPLHVSSRLYAPVLTYHACYPELPENVAAVDNIDPESLYQHLSHLKRHFRFVPVDEICEAKNIGGLAAVTFDDAYKGVFTHAFPVLNSLSIPFTVFVNTSTVEGSVHWRHKVISVINHGLAASVDAASVPNGNYYKAWKQPHYDSAALVERIDAVLNANKIVLDNHLIDNASYFIKHPLVWYGNHSHNHYVLSSISRERQWEEVCVARETLEKISGINISKTFALPFGETHHANRDTFAVVRDLGYSALLMNRGGVNSGRLISEGGIKIIERFSPVPANVDWQTKRESIRTLKSAANGLFRRPASTIHPAGQMGAESRDA